MSSSFHLSRFREVGKKIIGVGRNYSEPILHIKVMHAVELKNPVPVEPIIFLKPTTAYIVEGQKIKLPRGVSYIDHEVELGVVISSTACCVSEAVAADHIGGYILALDMTNREAQSLAKKSGLPWTLGKAFDTSCPVSHFIEKSSVPDPHNVELWLNVNDVSRQRASTTEMIFSIPFLISWISYHITLERGDVILTGTPSGVDSIQAGDRIDCGIGDLVTMAFEVESQQ